MRLRAALKNGDAVFDDLDDQLRRKAISGDDFTLLVRHSDEVADLEKTDLRNIQNYIDGMTNDPYIAGKNILDPDISVPEEKRLVRGIDAKGVKTKVGDVEVDDFAVLKKGDKDWGWEHIDKNHGKGSGTGTKYIDVFGNDDPEFIIGKIDDTVSNPDFHTIQFEEFDGKQVKKVLMAKNFGTPENPKWVLAIWKDIDGGSITTAIPETSDNYIFNAMYP